MVWAAATRGPGLATPRRGDKESSQYQYTHYGDAEARTAARAPLRNQRSQVVIEQTDRYCRVVNRR